MSYFCRSVHVAGSCVAFYDLIPDDDDDDGIKPLVPSFHLYANE